MGEFVLVFLVIASKEYTHFQMESTIFDSIENTLAFSVYKMQNEKEREMEGMRVKRNCYIEQSLGIDEIFYSSSCLTKTNIQI